MFHTDEFSIGKNQQNDLLTSANFPPVANLFYPLSIEMREYPANFSLRHQQSRSWIASEGPGLESSVRLA